MICGEQIFVVSGNLSLAVLGILYLADGKPGWLRQRRQPGLIAVGRKRLPA